MKSSRVLFVAAGIISLLAARVNAGERRCDACGCQADCKKICRLVPGTKEVVQTCYDCLCEDFCVPGPSRNCGRQCEEVSLPPYEGSGSDGNESTSCWIAWYKWLPGCARLRTRHVLLKYEIVKEVPTREWKVEYLCCECAATCGADRDALPSPPENH